MALSGHCSPIAPQRFPAQRQAPFRLVERDIEMSPPEALDRMLRADHEILTGIVRDPDCPRSDLGRALVLPGV
jgi:hypothetical protein